MVIVNLQPTVKDKEAALVIRAPIDRVLARAVQMLQADHPTLTIPTFKRTEPFKVSHGPVADGSGKWWVRVDDHLGAPLGFVVSVELKTAGGIVSILDRQPFYLEMVAPRGPVQVGVNFDRVPLGKGAFYQVPRMDIEYNAAAPEGQESFSVDLNPSTSFSGL
jgi:hypothetical protein